MKKLLLSLALVAGIATAQAQEFGFKQGDVILEGNIGFESSNNKNTTVKTNEFTLAPRVGYFLTDKAAIGIALNFSTAKTENSTSSSETKTNGLDVSVFGRYYFLELGKRFKTYAQGDLGYRSAKQETIASTGAPTVTVYDNSGFGLDATVGANYFLTEKLALNVSLTNVIGFNSMKPDGGKNISNFYLNAGSVDSIFDMATFGLTFKF